MPSHELGESIPADTAHAVSVSLPTWASNIGYEEGEQWVVSKMKTGYPRFFVHRDITGLAEVLASTYGQKGQIAMLFPIPAAARRCVAFIKERTTPEVAAQITTLDLSLDTSKDGASALAHLKPTISAVLYPEEAQPLAKQYWQHTGDGTSSRRAEFCHGLFKSGLLAPTQGSPKAANGFEPGSGRPFRGPKRYQRTGSIDGITAPPNKAPAVQAPEESQESSRFLEERFGRNLDLGLVDKAASAIRRRITSTLSGDMDLLDGPMPSFEASNTRGIQSLQESDIFLFSCGMNAIFNAHQALLKALEPRKSISCGFPYVDTLKILQKFGPGCQFYGHASSEDLDDLESRLKGGERFLALFCEFPGNPLLVCPDLKRIRKLADEYDFAVVVDETIGTFANINVLVDADIVVSSLTKLFSGDGNVMGGTIILNPQGQYYEKLKNTMVSTFENSYWPEDIIYLERNSRDFASRVERVNVNSEAICQILCDHPAVKTVYYPKVNPSRQHYDAYRLPTGGYGGLLSVVFQSQVASQAFYDALEIAKGPSLGTNFTLCSPYVLLAHYQELPWAASLGVDPYLCRVSVGLEETVELRHTFETALKAAEAALNA
ncbi:cys/Met metabolism PLP-dependent enzyme domain-containing protein [Sarocladium implicatum]|nr:cys/Met metabolism PLP-dependent enzyme domain-containing protein [Sarocladium implicatum]